MTWQHSIRSKTDYNDAAPVIKKAFDKQALLLAANMRHPSLRAKKIDETNNIWQARVNQAWRFYFRIEGDNYLILRIIPHPK
ncbi:MAG: hypothetical protein HYZ37_15015 [Candidatus Solibacter usitatus]|nr:hypothetical protein [Candidatus Solibacter usitatus]